MFISCSLPFSSAFDVLHTTPASFSCPQWLLPQPGLEQSAREDSLPAQFRPLNQTLPDPLPNKPQQSGVRAPSNPSWRQATCAFLRLQVSPHTVPHRPRWYISTLPTPSDDDPLSRIPVRSERILVQTERIQYKYESLVTGKY